MIKINGTQIPTPSTYQIGIMDLSIAERVASGLLMIERIATKRKIEMSWFYLTKEQLSSLLTLVSPVFFNVEYVDPQTDGVKTGEFYCGDRAVEAIDFRNGRIRYKNIKFNLIER
jgi:hypothetical protein